MGPVVNGQDEQQNDKSRAMDQRQRERHAHRNLDVVTSEAIDQALKLAPRVVSSPQEFGRGLPIEVSVASRSEARFVRKRINDALSVGEWLPEVQVLVWDHDEHLDEALTVGGQTLGFELRIIAVES